MSPEDVQVMLQAAAINALYSGKLPMCGRYCGRGAVWEAEAWGDLFCDSCLNQTGGRPVVEMKCAAVVRKLNALAGL